LENTETMKLWDHIEENIDYILVTQEIFQDLESIYGADYTILKPLSEVQSQFKIEVV